MPWMVSGTDLDGNARIIGSNVDIGAYESPSDYSPVVDITNQNAAVAESIDVYSISGTNNAYVEGHLWWTNTANGAHSNLPVSYPSFEIGGIPLDLGLNTVHVYGTNELGDVSQDTIDITRYGWPVLDITNGNETVSADTYMIRGTNDWLIG